MKKSEIAVQLTEENISTVYNILKMFNELIYSDIEEWKANMFYHDNPFTHVSFDRYDNSWVRYRKEDNKTIINPEKLKQLLAKESFKKGEIVKVTNSGKEWFTREFIAIADKSVTPYITYSESGKTIKHWATMRKIEPKITVTMQEIADLKGCTVEQLLIEK